MKSVRHLLMTVVSLFAVLASCSVTAQENLAPDVIVERLTVEMLTAIDAAKATFAENPEPFYQKLDEIVLPRMDIRSFARGVMGQYGSTAYYRSLNTAEEKTLFKTRVLAFTDLFKQSIVRTYGKGLMTFNGQTISLVPLDDEQQSKITAGKSLELLQLIESKGSDPHELRYSFARNRRGEWLIRNLLVDGINLGKVYQTQFSQAVKDNDGDVDMAIKNWSVTEEIDEQ